MVTETLICLFSKRVFCVIFGVGANYTKIPILNAVTGFVLGGNCLANGFRGGQNWDVKLFMHDHS